MDDEPATRIVGVITAGVVGTAAVVESGVARFEGHGEGGVHVRNLVPLGFGGVMSRFHSVIVGESDVKRRLLSETDATL